MPPPNFSALRFFNPTRIICGDGARAELSQLVPTGKILIITTKRGRAQFEADTILLSATNDVEKSWVDNVLPNPGLVETQDAIERLSSREFDAIIAFGGGSSMDAAKAIGAALSCETASPNLAEIISTPSDYLTRPLIPIFAVPTTAGTGSEVTPFATIWDHQRAKKLSLYSPRLFPHTAIIDPQLTYGVPRQATLATGLDAMNQAFESVWNRNCSALTLPMAARAISLALDALPVLLLDLQNINARASMAEASLLAGMCISQTRTAICHAMSYPLTARFNLPHGLACAFTMSAVAHDVMDNAPECLENLAALTCYGNAKELLCALDAVLVSTNVAAWSRSMMPSKVKAMALTSEMYTPGRTDNYIGVINDDVLQEIIAKSWDN